MRQRSCGGLIELIVRHRLRICQPSEAGRRGAVCFMYTPSHEYGAMPNQYADAVATVESRKTRLIKARRDIGRANDAIKALL